MGFTPSFFNMMKTGKKQMADSIFQDMIKDIKIEAGKHDEHTTKAIDMLSGAIETDLGFVIAIDNPGGKSQSMLIHGMAATDLANHVLSIFDNFKEVEMLVAMQLVKKLKKRL